MVFNQVHRGDDVAFVFAHFFAVRVKDKAADKRFVPWNRIFVHQAFGNRVESPCTDNIVCLRADVKRQYRL